MPGRGVIAAGLALLLAGCGQPAYQVFAVRVASAPPPAGTAPDRRGRGSAGPGLAAGEEKLDLNRVTAAGLRRLPGMSAAVIAAILAGRPYTAKRQLLRRGVLTAEQYANWKDELVVHSATARAAPARFAGGGQRRRRRR